ncbi:MAG: hypothetical protein A4E52_00636 [Pelotomaculum sp. PtaB.Bin013]|uniref:Uncharacterized protein n=1 Tax=Pelotomaculum isophthalicicum JI TaxID=947010 RepID=A0A9X4H203_9FIRM|nr:hypothetical protein [Pelotomaculum isophthalicicum]MDF9406903.1 hypothetical protein [Pelotomaculum isophthalicicum JI]OPX91029.1 MAG: hypothetical protein A4E52_00636 [Pelotomaculum sp. PtaB.Bin013]
MKRVKQKKKEPTLAPGSKGILEKSASKEEIKKGEFTKVTNLSFDEADPS